MNPAVNFPASTVEHDIRQAVVTAEDTFFSVRAGVEDAASDKLLKKAAEGKIEPRTL